MRRGRLRPRRLCAVVRPRHRFRDVVTMSATVFSPENQLKNVLAGTRWVKGRIRANASCAACGHADMRSGSGSAAGRAYVRISEAHAALCAAGPRPGRVSETCAYSLLVRATWHGRQAGFASHCGGFGGYVFIRYRASNGVQPWCRAKPSIEYRVAWLHCVVACDVPLIVVCRACDSRVRLQLKVLESRFLCCMPFNGLR